MGPKGIKREPSWGVSMNPWKLMQISKSEHTFFFFFSEEDSLHATLKVISDSEKVKNHSGRYEDLSKSAFIMSSELHQYHLENNGLCVIHMQRLIRI